jgi:hypothetical protein
VELLSDLLTFVKKIDEEDDEDGTNHSLYEKIKNCCQSRDPISKDTIK